MMIMVLKHKSSRNIEDSITLTKKYGESTRGKQVAGLFLLNSFFSSQSEKRMGGMMSSRACLSCLSI